MYACTWLYGGAKFGLEDECIEVQLRAGEEVGMTVEVDVPAEQEG